MTQYDFIHKKLFPLLSFSSKQLIHNYTSSQFSPAQCIDALTNRKIKLQVEVNNLEEALKLLNNLKN